MYVLLPTSPIGKPILQKKKNRNDDLEDGSVHLAIN